MCRPEPKEVKTYIELLSQAEAPSWFNSKRDSFHITSSFHVILLSTTLLGEEITLQQLLQFWTKLNEINESMCTQRFARLRMLMEAGADHKNLSLLESDK